MKKIVYPRICKNHPNVTHGLYYTYPPGFLLCEKCRKDLKK